MPDRAELEEAAYLRRVRGEALAVLSWLHRSMEDEMADGVRVTQVRVQAPSVTGRGFRVVLSGVDEGGRKFVAFAGGEGVQEALSSMRKAYEEKGLRWYDDKPYEERKGGKETS